MKHIINILLILWVNIMFAQYPLIEEFDIIEVTVPTKGLHEPNYVYFNPLGQIGGRQFKKQLK